ncbi:MAG: hypothetical protein ACFFER_01270 [Candidatus Thorarchaeota archaeon]
MNEYTDEFDIDAFIHNYVKEPELNSAIEREAREIMKGASEAGIHPGQRPVGQASAAVYVAAILTKNRATQRALAEFAGVSEATIQKRYVELAGGLGYYRSER